MNRRQKSGLRNTCPHGKDLNLITALHSPVTEHLKVQLWRRNHSAQLGRHPGRGPSIEASLPVGQVSLVMASRSPENFLEPPCQRNAFIENTLKVVSING